MQSRLVIDRVAGEIIHLVGPCVHTFVCGHSPVWTVWPLTLIFGMRVDLDLGYPAIVCQGRGQTLKIVYVLPFEPVVRSRLILGLSLSSSASGNCNDHYQSTGIVCLSVIKGRSTCRSISFNFELDSPVREQFNCKTVQTASICAMFVQFMLVCFVCRNIILM